MNKKFCPRVCAVFSLVVSLLALMLLCGGCGKNAFQESDGGKIAFESGGARTGGGRTHVWYAFTKNGFARIDFPTRAKKADFAPWTETARVCDAAMLGNGSSREAFFLVNRLGILTFLTDGSIKLARDVSYFSRSTVDSFFIAPDSQTPDTGALPVFHHYTNAVFNNTDMPRETIIIRFDPGAQVFYPALLKREVKLEPQDEVTALSYNDGEWFFQIKRGESESRWTDYRAYSFLESLANPGVKKRILEREITQDDFRNSLQSESYAEYAPARLKNLLPAIPPNARFFLECRFQDLSAPKRFGQNSFEKTDEDSVLADPADLPDTVEVNGYAVIADTYSAALFEDGTVYFQGALTGYPSYKNNEVAVFKLPPLGEGFIYGVCTISGGKLFASWEERRFYETARSGFVQVNLDTLLYGYTP
jgi:hypothetical protein